MRNIRAVCLALSATLLTATCRDSVVQPEAEPVNGALSALTQIVVEQSSSSGCQPWSWSVDHTTCINNTIASVGQNGTVIFTRGQTYNYSSMITISNGTSLVAGGSGPRPILSTTQSIAGGSIWLGPHGRISNLDIRGPYYGLTDFTFDYTDPYGVNGTISDNWTIEGSSINGFKGHGVLAANSDSVRITNSNISHNGASGIALYADIFDWRCGSGAVVTGNTLDYNGMDGMDVCSSYSLYEGNVARWNGWGEHSGDGNGILVCVDTSVVKRWGPVTGIEIRKNVAHGNREEGIYINGICGDPAGTSISGVAIANNWSEANRQGIRYSGTLFNITVSGNAAWQNSQSCWNFPYSGVTGGGQWCNVPFSASIDGPSALWTCNGMYEPPGGYNVSTIGGTGLYTYQWFEDYVYVGSNSTHHDLQTSASGFHDLQITVLDLVSGKATGDVMQIDVTSCGG